MDYYNEIDAFAVQWLRNLTDQGVVPAGEVDERSICDVRPEDLGRLRRVHLFAGIGGWAEACRLAGWPSDIPIWSGSCPCQPFSLAGKRKGNEDSRHLWPEMFRLIHGCRPPVVVGEQVSQKNGLAWLDGVCDDLERIGYTCGAYDLAAGGFSAPHKRQRLYWFGVLGVSTSSRCEVRCRIGADDRQELSPALGAGDLSSAWNDSILLPCTDGKVRRIGSRVFPLAHGIPRSVGPEFSRSLGVDHDPKGARAWVATARRNRTGRIRGYGNAIVPAVAAEFLKVVLNLVLTHHGGGRCDSQQTS